MSRKFKWQAWDYDCDGTAYIISKSECPIATMYKLIDAGLYKPGRRK